MTAKPFIFLISASLALGLAGCADNSTMKAVGKGAAQGAVEGVAQQLLIITAPITVPALIIYCVANGCKGSGTSPSSDLADWRAKADKGDAQAQWILGGRYFHGYGGVAADDAKAASWYQRSANQGYADAQLSLGLQYEWGRGVKPDNVQADMWYSIAIATATTEDNTATAGHANEIRDEIERRMTPDETVEARKRAEEWKPNSLSAADISPVSQTEMTTKTSK